MKLTQEVLKQLVKYDPLTGAFTWKMRDIKFFKDKRSMDRWNTSYAGVETATNTSCYGYKRLSLLGVGYRAHRIVFLYMTGEMPDQSVDHINHIKHDNRWVNLRKADCSSNARNKSKFKRNTSGVTGVSWDKVNSKWSAYICVDTVSKGLGRFTQKWDAICCRKSAEFVNGFHPNHGT